VNSVPQTILRCDRLIAPRDGWVHYTESSNNCRAVVAGLLMAGAKIVVHIEQRDLRIVGKTVELKIDHL
jgi:hypothetical protein